MVIQFICLLHLVMQGGSFQQKSNRDELGRVTVSEDVVAETCTKFVQTEYRYSLLALKYTLGIGVPLSV